MASVSIGYSIASDGAQQLAKKLGVDYSGHKRICGVNVTNEEKAIADKLNQLVGLATKDNGSIKFHYFITPGVKPKDVQPPAEAEAEVKTEEQPAAVAA